MLKIIYGDPKHEFVHFSSRTRFFDRLSKTVFGHKTAPEQWTPFENRCKWLRMNVRNFFEKMWLRKNLQKHVYLQVIFKFLEFGWFLKSLFWKRFMRSWKCFVNSLFNQQHQGRKAGRKAREEKGGKRFVTKRATKVSTFVNCKILISTIFNSKTNQYMGVQA